MLEKIKQRTLIIFKNTFFQLALIYAILLLLVSLSLFWKYTFHFEIFALIIAVFGISLVIEKDNGLGENKIRNRKLHHILFFIALFLIFIFRAVPYFHNSAPLGYDAGIYKYGIENGLGNYDQWILNGGLEPGFLYLMKFFSFFLSSQFILTWLLIIFCVLLGFSIYLVAKQFFNSKVALIALFVYAFSLIQFKTFSMMYYKNIIGLSLMLFAVYFLKKSETRKRFIWLFVLFAGILGAIHRPTFYILGLGYFFYMFVEPYKNKVYSLKKLVKNILFGLLILIIAGLFYIGKFSPAILNMFGPVLESFVNPGTSPGTFVDFFTYQYLTLVYLPFALIGLFYLVRKKQFNILFFMTLVCAIIVYFKFFFFNRFIIHLDIFLIILASVGFYILIKEKKRFSILVLILLVVSSGFLIYHEAKNTKPLINQDELQTIKFLNTTEENAFVMSTYSYYSPWVLGYSNRKTIAPGLFDYDKWDLEQWKIFWDSRNMSQIKELFEIYPNKTIYVFIGEKQPDYIKKIENFNDCFEVYYTHDRNKIYKYVC